MADSKRIFTYRQALASFPEVENKTRQAAQQVEALINRIKSRDEMELRRDQLKEACEAIVERWASQVEALGCEVKGPWLVDWDSGDGYYCWRYPEDTIVFFHTYEDGFQGRVPIN